MRDVGRRQSGCGREEVLAVAAVTFFLALIALADKLKVSPTYFDGVLEQNHQQLLAFQHANNEQSRLLQFSIPELLVRLFGLSVPHAYLLQRWLFVWLALLLFYLYLRSWFRPGAAFAGVCFLAAVLPLSQMSDLQESAPFLMVSFLCGLWAIRAGRPLLFLLALLIGVLNNETTLILPVVWFLTKCEGRRPKQLWSAAWRAAALAAPAVLVTAVIRYVTRDQPHLGGAWHLPDNLLGIGKGLLFFSPLDYWRDDYLLFLFLYGPLWVFAYLRWARKPRFVRATLLMAPLFVVAHLITGIIAEPRQMVPLAYVLIPAGFFWLFPGDAVASTASVNPSPACPPSAKTSG
jgi:hypothetical protein